MKQKILVTGSEGFIGKKLIEKLEYRDYIVKTFDIKNGQDVCDFNLLHKTIQGVDGVIHLAAVSRVVFGYENPYKTVTTNLIGTANILESIRQNNTSCWMIFGSSREVYGEGGESVTEENPLNPINVYGATKVGCEYLTLNYGTNYGINTYVVRFTNVYGGINDHPDRLIPRFVNQALTNSDFTINGGSQKFDFIHLEDATDGLIALVEKIVNKSILKEKTFNFVTGYGTTIKELVEKLIKITNSKSKTKYLPERAYDVNTFVGNPSRALKILNWKAKKSIDEGLSEYIELISSRN